MFKQPAFWISTISAVASWVAVWFSFQSSRRANRSLQLAIAQEARHTPNFGTYLSEGLFKTINDIRSYAFCLSISNLADNNNSLTRIDLRITYTTPDKAPMIVRIQHNPNRSQNFISDQNSSFSLPCRIDSHQTIKGWVFFDISKSYVKDADIHNYELVIMDSHGIEISIKPIIITECT
jgi:hypothetical protein